MREFMNKRRINKKLLATLILSFGLIVGFLPQIVTAATPPIASSPCDPLYYKSLSARAWLEAEREITQNQNLILKPDSVLEYTCFDLFLRELATHASNMLSETSLYGSPMSNTSMDNALDDLVGDSLINYINANFEQTASGSYDLLGGHTAGMGIDHTPTAITGGAYSCDIMRRVWQAAKCINFISDPFEDGFYTFQEYASANDKRHLPDRCTAIGGTWSTNLTTAINSPPWTDDPVKTYLNNLNPSLCAASTPIPTGIKVNRPVLTPTTYDEKICIPPGCRYNPVTSLCTPS
ncbi:MAG: hypothetical protein KDI13_09490 [Alphaproteobacteria bacterium]|nr:hypothetical protein [Alphaproteobacteria bacterium]